LKATNTHTAMRKCPIGQTPCFKRKTSAFLKVVKWPNNHNIGTTKSSPRLSQRLQILIASCRHV